MTMDKSCCWKGDFSALLRGKVTIVVGRVCLVPANIGVIGHFVLLVAWLFGFLVRESRYFSWLGQLMVDWAWRVAAWAPSCAR